MVDMLGLEGERFRLVWCSSAEADRFVGAVRDMTEKMRKLGPSPYRENGYRENGESHGSSEEVATCR